MVIFAYRRRIKTDVKALGAEFSIEAEGRSEPVSSAPPTSPRDGRSGSRLGRCVRTEAPGCARGQALHYTRLGRGPKRH